MFFEGTLQDGIALAVREGKMVVCFVTDTADDSNQWENELLLDPSIAPTLARDAVLLRMEAGSQEAGYLSAMLPVSKYPTVVMMTNQGVPKEYIVPPVSNEAFSRRVKAAMGVASDPQPSVETSTAESPPLGLREPPVEPRIDADIVDSSGIPEPSTDSLQDQPSEGGPSESGDASELTRMPTRAELEAERLSRVQAKLERGKGKESTDKARVKSDEERKYSDALKKKKLEDQEAKRRVLQRIRDDRADRERRDMKRKGARLQSVRESSNYEAAANPDAQNPQGEGEVEPGNQTKNLSRLDSVSMASLQIRLFDGSTIRSRFPLDGTLQKEIRPWVDRERKDGTAPYSFKVMMAPLPNRDIDIAEEDMPLSELDLAPSSTLVLVPARKYADAYDSSARGLTKHIKAFFNWVFVLLATFFSTLFSSKQTNAATTPASRQTTATYAGNARGGRAKEKEQKQDHQLYNGNSLNFEPRREDEE